MTRNEWWHGAVIYQIYPRSFCDSNADGIGDLKGITRKLDYLAALNIDAIWISPFFKSPMRDFGYDVSDYRAVDPIFGDLDDFDELLREAHARNIKILIDQVISHTSDEHPWFKESRSSRTNPKADWYLWADPLPDGTPPNNWLSIFGGSAWQWDSRRGQYYLHNFLVSQPDLNWNNPEVVAACLAESEFWLKRGVDGFRLDAINFFTQDKGLRSNPPRLPEERYPDGVSPGNPFAMQKLMFNFNRPENLFAVESIRRLLDKYPGSLGLGEVLCGDNSIYIAAQYVGGNDRLHTCYTFGLLQQEFSKQAISTAVTQMETAMGPSWPCWAFGNHDVPRVMTRWGGPQADERFAKMIMALKLCLRGVMCMYQGDELGLSEADVPFEFLRDPYGIAFWPEFKGRDGCRTPMPWEQGKEHGGFTEGHPWLPVATDHLLKAVDVQDNNPGSVLNSYRKFLAWRKTQPVILSGKFREVETVPEIYGYERFNDDQRIVLLFNLTRQPVRCSLQPWSGCRPMTVDGFDFTIDGEDVVLPAYGVFFGDVSPLTNGEI